MFTVDIKQDDTTKLTPPFNVILIKERKIFNKNNKKNQSFRNFSIFLFSTSICEPILMKICMNTNIMKRQIHEVGHKWSLKVT